MKKGILCILLSLLMIIPLFTACSEDGGITETEVSIYTLYTICDESTSPDAIRQVELALNRILFYRLGVILDLQMVTEDEYDEFLDSKLEDFEQYQAEKKANKGQSSVAEEGTIDELGVMSGDRVLEMLENNEDIVLKNPRMDIFLVRGYDKYYELATEGKLAAIDEKLLNEGKALTSAIHTTLFGAAKVGGKTYGVPVNNAIGEYTYLVFDEELLNKYSVDPNTIKTLEDLQDYLELIKTNEQGVVPLKNAVESADSTYLLNDGFPAIVNNKKVEDAYNNKNVQNYFSMIARYNALGYIGNSQSEDDNTRYAVRIETGLPEDIEARLANTGYDYAYSLYANPIATNETTIDNIFCISSYVVSNELTEVIKIITALNTDAQLMNLLTYGVEKTHYVLNDNGQVERLDNETPYIVNPNYMGNCFITYTLDGENPEKWNNQIKQNQDAVPSASLGFTMTPTKLTYNVETTAEDGSVTTEEKYVLEPDYVTLVNSIVDKYYPNLMAGNAVQFDYNTLVAEATEDVKIEYTKKLDKNYEEKILIPMLREQQRESVEAERGEQLRNDASTAIRNAYEGKDGYTEEKINALIEEMYVSKLEAAITSATNALKGTSEYERAFAELKASEAYVAELDAMMTHEGPAAIQKKVDAKITALIAEYTTAMKAEIEVAIETEVETFITENSEILGMTRDEILLAIGYLGEKEVTEEGGESGETSGEVSDETSGETSTAESSDVSAEESSEVSDEESAETSAEESSEAATEESSEASAEESTEESTEGEESEEGEGEDAPSSEIVELYESWYDFFLIGKVGGTYSTLFPAETTTAA